MIVYKDFIDKYLSDESNFKGNLDTVYIPENVEELKDIVVDCYNKGLHITLRGGGTGLTGGSSPDKNVLISLEKLNNIKSFDKSTERVVIEPCVSLEQLDAYLSNYNYFYPPNPTETKASIAGNVSTNASGARSFKYGATRNFIMKLKVLLCDGTFLTLERGKNFAKDNKLAIKSDDNKTFELDVENIFNTSIKNAAGYYITENMDAIDLFIGSEGTLGIITEIELKVNKKSEHLVGIIAWFENFYDVYKYIANFIQNKEQLTKEDLCPRIIEFYDTNSLMFLREEYSQIPETAKYAVWIEQECELKREDEIISYYYEIISSITSLDDDTWIALTNEEHNNFIKIRHTLPEKTTELVRKLNHTKLSVDMAVPFNRLKDYFEFVENKFKTLSIPSCVYGHISCSHLHCDMFYKNDEEKLIAEKIYSDIIDYGLTIGGTVSAEHGIGKIKREFFYRMYTSEQIDKMKKIKAIFDKKNILDITNLFY